MGFKPSDFKMLEEAPYEYPAPAAYFELVMNGIKQEEKTLGPAFTSRYIKYALQFLAQKYGEEPSDIKTLDQLKNYLIAAYDNCPACYPPVIIYAQVRTETELEGRAGVAGTRFEMMGIAKDISGRSASKDKEVDLDALVLKLRQVTLGMKVAPQKWGYTLDEDGKIVILHPTCYLLEGCRAAFNDGFLKRPNGGLRCGITATAIQYFTLVTGNQWDYELLEFDKPYCISKAFMV
ncbi:MAG: hypothetical protein WED07_13845 [Candidatus Freyarchaeum deiterrae]